MGRSRQGLGRQGRLTAWFDGFTRETRDTKGLPVTFRRSTDGASDKPVLVLLHGFPQTHVMWQRVALNQPTRVEFRS